jgi:5-hydroxyisourate hydrolase-like protein (transthyretin family)
MPGRLMTEVIDSARGVPASGMLIDLFRLPRGVGERHHLKTVETNQGGGTDAPLVEGDALVPATYELLFHVGRYFKAQRVPLAATPFLDVVPVRFAIADAARGYRLTLLAGPLSYTIQAATTS